MTRETYDNDLLELRDGVVQLSLMVDRAVAKSTDALVRHDFALAQQVIDDDVQINQLRWKLEDDALTLIATQAPMARDLRAIAAGLHILTDLERMGDHAAGNGKITLLIANEAPLKPFVDIPRMSDKARRMLADSISAFIQQDVELARETVDRDDEVDDLYNQVYRELLTFMMADPSTITRATHLLWASHNLERIADRSTNICEQVIFLASGRLESVDTSNY